MKRFLKVTLITSLVLVGILGTIILVKSSLDERVFALNGQPGSDVMQDEDEQKNTPDIEPDIEPETEPGIEIDSGSGDKSDENQDNEQESDDKGMNDPTLHIDKNIKDIIGLVGEEVVSFDRKNILPVKNPNSIYVLVNKCNELDSRYIPEDLVIPNVKFSFAEDNPKKQMRAVAAKALEELLGAANKEGYDIRAVSGYRSYDRQKTIYQYNVNTMGEEATNKVSAMPGQSEHQTGLAMDVSSKSVSYGLVDSLGETPEGIWLAEHAHEYGFIIRYKKNKTDITGYSYEPWHVRYLGKELATYLVENDLTLEEFYESLK